MQRFILTIIIFLAVAGCAVAQGLRIPNRMLPQEITGKDKVTATVIEAGTTLSVGGYPVTTSGSGDYVTTDTAQVISGVKTFTTTQNISEIFLGDQPTKLHRISQNAPGSVAWRLPTTNASFNVVNPTETQPIVLFGWVTGGPYSFLSGDWKWYHSAGFPEHMAKTDASIDFKIPFVCEDTAEFQDVIIADEKIDMSDRGAGSIRILELPGITGTGIKYYHGNGPDGGTLNFHQWIWGLGGGYSVAGLNRTTSAGSSDATTLFVGNPWVPSTGYIAIGGGGVDDQPGQLALANDKPAGTEDLWRTFLRTDETLGFARYSYFGGPFDDDLKSAAQPTFAFLERPQTWSAVQTHTTTQAFNKGIEIGDAASGAHKICQDSLGTMRLVLPADNVAAMVMDKTQTIPIFAAGMTAPNSPLILARGDVHKFNRAGSNIDVSIDDTAANFDIPIEADIVEWGPGHSSHAWFDPFLFWGRNTTGSGSPISIGVMLENTGTLTGIDYTMPFLAQRLTAGFKHVQPIIALQDRPNSPRVIAIGWDTTYEAHANKATMVEMSPDTIYGGALYDDAYLIRYPWRPLNDFFWRFDGLLSTPGTVRCTSLTRVHSTTDLLIDGPVSIRDSAGTTQFRIGSIPNAPNGLTSQGETVLTSVTLASVGGGMTTDTAQDITGSKAFKSRQDFDATAGSHDMVNVFSSGTYSGVALRVQSIATTNTQPLAQFNNNAPAPSVQGQTSWNSVNAIGVYGFAGHAAATGVKAHNNAGGLALDVDGDADIDGDVDHQGDYNLDGNIVINGDIECLDLTVDNEITAAVGSVLTIRGAASQRIDMYDGGSNLAMRVWPTNTTVDFEQGVQGIANAAGLAVGVRGYDNATANQTAMNARQRATSGNGMALAVEQTGVTLTGNMTGTLGDFYRTYTLAGNDITGAMVRIWDNAQVDGVSSADLLMVKVTSASNTGKSHIKMESTSAAQTGADYIIDTLGPGAAHPFSLDWDGNLASDGEADYDSYVTAGGPSDHPEGVNVSAITTPAAPTSGVTFFANSSDTPSVIASDGTTSALISQFVGRKAEGELSTVSTSYTTAVTLTFDINSLSGHRMMFFCEVAGEDTSTSCDVRIIVDDTKVVSARNFSFGETYSNNGWQSFCGFNWDPATIGSHTVKVQYKTRNGSKTVYLRRIRVTCERCY